MMRMEICVCAVVLDQLAEIQCIILILLLVTILPVEVLNKQRAPCLIHILIFFVD